MCFCFAVLHSFLQAQTALGVFIQSLMTHSLPRLRLRFFNIIRVPSAGAVCVWKTALETFTSSGPCTWAPTVVQSSRDLTGLVWNETAVIFCKPKPSSASCCENITRFTRKDKNEVLIESVIDTVKHYGKNGRSRLKKRLQHFYAHLDSSSVDTQIKLIWRYNQLNRNISSLMPSQTYMTFFTWTQSNHFTKCPHV